MRIAAIIFIAGLFAGCATQNTRVIDLTNQRPQPTVQTKTETKPDGTINVYNFTR